MEGRSLYPRKKRHCTNSDRSFVLAPLFLLVGLHYLSLHSKRSFTLQHTNLSLLPLRPSPRAPTAHIAAPDEQRSIHPKRPAKDQGDDEVACAERLSLISALEVALGTWSGTGTSGR